MMADYIDRQDPKRLLDTFGVDITMGGLKR